jgi:hypothetical protein
MEIQTVRAIAIKVATVIARTTLVATNRPNTVTIGGAGSSGQVLVAGAGGASGTNTFGAGKIPSTISITGGGGNGGNYATMATGAGNTAWHNTNAKISMQGQLTLEGENPDIMIGGKSMVTWMQKVEQRLSILEPKPELLAKYAALQQAYEHYKTLEALLHGTENDS